METTLQQSTMDEIHTVYTQSDTSEVYTTSFIGGGGFVYSGGGDFLTETQLTIISVTAALLGSFIMIGNSLVVFSILRPKNRAKLLTPTNILIVELSVADFFVGALTIPFFVLQYYGLPHNYIGCILTMGLSSMVPTVASLFGCLFLSIERYLAIQYPYLWERVVNTRSVTITSVVIWTFAVCYNLSLFGINKGWNRMDICVFYLLMKTEFLVYVSFISCQLIPCIFMIFMYSRIFITARRHLLRVVPGGQSAAGSQGPASGKVSISKQIRIAQKCFVIVVVMMSCVLPSGVANSISLYLGVQNTYVQIAFAVLIFLNSAINPFMYAWSNAKLKSEIKKLLCFWKDPQAFDAGDSLQLTAGGSENTCQA